MYSTRFLTRIFIATLVALLLTDCDIDRTLKKQLKTVYIDLRN